MKTCRFCELVRNRFRSFRDIPEEPFLILVLRAGHGDQIPILVAREHGPGTVTGHQVIVGLEALRDVAARAFGVGFTIRYDGLVRGHWTARAIPLRLRRIDPVGKPSAAKSKRFIQCPECRAEVWVDEREVVVSR